MSGLPRQNLDLALPEGWHLSDDLRLFVVRSWYNPVPAGTDKGDRAFPAAPGDIQVGPPPSGLPITFAVGPGRWMILDGADATSACFACEFAEVFDETAGYSILEAAQGSSAAAAALRRLITPVHAVALARGQGARLVRLGDMRVLFVDDGALAIRFIVARSYSRALVGWLEAASRADPLPPSSSPVVAALNPGRLT